MSVWQRRVYLFLGCIWFVLLTAGLIGTSGLWGFAARHGAALKAASSAVLVLLAWLLAVGGPSNLRAVASLVATGMSLGALGDASPLLGDWWPNPQRMLVNMLLFGAGHLAYLRACWLLRDLAAPRRRWAVCLIAALVIGAIVWYLAVATATRNATMRGPALPYTLLLSATMGSLAALAIDRPRYLPAAVGGVLFFVSDTLLAIGLFRGIQLPKLDWVWLAYGPGQMLIVCGLAGASRLEQHDRTQRSMTDSSPAAAG